MASTNRIAPIFIKVFSDAAHMLLTAVPTFGFLTPVVGIGTSEHYIALSDALIFVDVLHHIPIFIRETVVLIELVVQRSPIRIQFESRFISDI